MGIFKQLRKIEEYSTKVQENRGIFYKSVGKQRTNQQEVRKILQRCIHPNSGKLSGIDEYFTKCKDKRGIFMKVSEN